MSFVVVSSLNQDLVTNIKFTSNIKKGVQSFIIFLFNQGQVTKSKTPSENNKGSYPVLSGNKFNLIQGTIGVLFFNIIYTIFIYRVLVCLLISFELVFLFLILIFFLSMYTPEVKGWG